ncbi:glycoside hydrolase family 3 N-terminal domain-containing protein [Halalkalibacter sp. APA_J-10(15)]|uniref:glycoside hydrolase family 3 N-terminal domain-containing protein n=1 Tax=Halalkalibacter sp. APA_J-10(15) TaxID=2933805 RepID=UPI001FF6A430|nr:glycoside hydrolase family 3 N-terminal domain-containing protein [Halalkalibacter sp. APA_J-10(15)]MCK0470157.1 glycoside hydrolase family 3 C-terminal domain-containing protein [Halalkalibacter sp. APA_J-10(15)]
MDIYLDPYRSIEERVEDLLQRMTLNEKVGQLNQHLYGWEAYKKKGDLFELTDIFKEEVKKWNGLGVLYGLFRADPWSGRSFENGITAVDSPKVANQIQQYIKEHTRLAIPALLAEECPHGHQALDGTMIPTNIGVGSTWNPDLMKGIYQNIAKEIRCRGAHLGLISTLDILRDPRWGRSEECFSEDPFLAGAMTEAVVYGLQGDVNGDLSAGYRIGAILKHFCAQGAGEGGLNAAPANIGERELRDIHLPGMKKGSDAGAIGCMSAYNEIDGVPCHANKTLLTEILREEWSFSGIVMADGLAIDRLQLQGNSDEQAAAIALQAGVDVSLWDKAFTTLEDAVKKGLISEATIDRSVRRVLHLKFSLGLFERPFVDEGKVYEVIGNKELKKRNLQVARESVVLLKNEGKILPLTRAYKKVAVIGPNANTIYNQLGDYTAIQPNGKGTTVLEGIRQCAPPHVEILYTKGCGVRDRSKDGFQGALKLAQEADIIVLAVGGSSSRDFNMTFDTNGAAIPSNQPLDMDCGEGMDVADLELGGVQNELIESLSQLGKPMVAVLIQGRPHSMQLLVRKCSAVLCGWYPGLEGGQAIGEILYGFVNPSGKLPVSIPRSSSRLPIYYNRKDMGHSLTYCDVESTPEYVFGYGLSYSEFEYEISSVSRTKISIHDLNKGKTIKFDIKVKNVGNQAGAEVIQLYRYDVESTVTSRVRELKGFQKVFLMPKETQMVSFRVGKEEMAIWNKEMDYCVESGLMKWFIGTDSTASSEITIEIEGAEVCTLRSI